MTRIVYPERYFTQREDNYGPCEICGVMGLRERYSVGHDRHSELVSICPDCADLPRDQAHRLAARAGSLLPNKETS